MIFTTDKLSDNSKLFEGLDPSTLVIFDVDDVLFEPTDQILRGHYFKKVMIFENMIDAKYDKKTAEELYSIIWNERKIKVMEEKTVSLIESLQEKNIPVIALTNCIIGRFGLIESVEEWRLKELKNCGYHLDKSWPNFEEKTFEHSDGMPLENQTRFKSGVIFTNNIQKGEALEKFLEHFNVKPNHIIFVDDLLKNLVSVQDMCAKLDIKFTGIEYIAAANSYKKPCNLDIAKMQVHLLETERKWITDEEAHILQTNKPEYAVNELDFPLKNLHFQKISPTHISVESVITPAIGNPTGEKIMDVLKSYEEPDRILFGAFLSEHLIAVIGVKIGNVEVIILHISVLPELREQNIGTKLLDFVTREFANHKISLETDEESVEFYQKNGFLCDSFKGTYGNLRYKCSLILNPQGKNSST